MKKTAIVAAFTSLLAMGMGVAGDWSRPAKSVPAKNIFPAAPIQENCLSYDFIDLDYRVTEYGSHSLGTDRGWSVGFSKSLGKTFYMRGSYGEGGYLFNRCTQDLIDTDTKRYRFGLGARKSIARCVDLTFEGGATYSEFDYAEGFRNLDYDSWGYYFGPGIRARSGRFEFYANAFYFHREGDLQQQYLAAFSPYHGRADEYGWVFTPGVLVHLTDHFAVKVGGELYEHESSLLLGARLHF